MPRTLWVHIYQLSAALILFLELSDIECRSSVFCSNAVWQGEVLLLQISHQRAAVDLASDPLLHHLPPVEFQTWVYCLHTHCCKVHRGLYFQKKSWNLSWLCLSVELRWYVHVSIWFSVSLFYSYAEVRAEQRRELGIEESLPEISADKVRQLSDMN